MSLWPKTCCTTEIGAPCITIHEAQLWRRLWKKSDSVGALLRYGISGVAYRFLGPTFPWGTLAANLIGCFFVGLLWAASDRAALPPNVRAFLFIGVIGALTTFSTYGLESIDLLREGEVVLGVTNIVLSILY